MRHAIVNCTGPVNSPRGGVGRVWIGPSQYGLFDGQCVNPCHHRTDFCIEGREKGLMMGPKIPKSDGTFTSYRTREDEP